MSRYESGVDAVRVNPSPELVRWLEKDAPKGRQEQNILIDYVNSQSSIRPSSSTDEIILAYREFKPITSKYDKLPQQLYRYVLKPVRGITAEQILKQGKGKYIVDKDWDWVYPALMPDTVTHGAVTTDWHFCFPCFSGMSKSHHNLTFNDVTKIKAENRYHSSKTPRSRIDNLSFLSKEKVPDIWGIDEPVLSGKAASEALESYQTQYAALASEIGDNNKNKKAYQDFIKNTYQPLTFKSWAKTQGCAAEPVDYKWDAYDRVGNDVEALRGNRQFINCTSKALESYDFETYINQYPNIKAKEKALRSNIKGHNFTRVTIHTAEQMMDDAVGSLEWASYEIEDVYQQRSLNAEMAQARAQNEAWADQELSNSMSSIQSLNDQVYQAQQDTQRMIAQINSQQVKSNINNAKAKARAQPRQTAQTAQNLSAASDQVSKTAAEAKTSPTVVKSEPAPQQANRIVGSARDYKMTGTSTTYYGRDTAIDLAQTNLKNQAAKFCGDTFKTQITWSEPNCTKHESDETYMCSQNGLVNCWEQRCETEYCSTQ